MCSSLKQTQTLKKNYKYLSSSLASRKKKKFGSSKNRTTGDNTKNRWQLTMPATWQIILPIREVWTDSFQHVLGMHFQFAP